MEKKVYLLRESLIQSILADIFSLGLLFGAVWFNQEYIGGSYFLNGVILILWIASMHAMVINKSTRFTSKEALIKHLKA